MTDLRTLADDELAALEGAIKAERDRRFMACPRCGERHDLWTVHFCGMGNFPLGDPKTAKMVAAWNAA